MAIEDLGDLVKGWKIEVVGADHQNKPDIGSNIVRQWIDVDKVDVIVDVPTSSVALAVNEIVKEKNKVFLVSGAASSDLTGPRCSPTTVHWTYDTWALANGTGNAIVKTGGDSWFFLTADYAFGHALERDTMAVVTKNGGKVVGAVRHPFPGQDFSSFLLQAQASKAKIIGLANAGADTTNAIKQAAEFGITQKGQNLAGLLVFLTDVHGLGLKTAQGLIFTEAWYWDMNDANRAFAKRFAAANRGVHPSMVHAGVYSSVQHYVKSVIALKSAADGKAVVDHMKKNKTKDALFGEGEIRADGRKISSDVSLRSEEAGRIEGSVGLLQTSRDHSGERSVPSARRRQVPARQRLTATTDEERALTARSSTGGIDGHQSAGAIRPALDRADQRLVLCAAQSRARRDLRHAQHHQFRARRPVYDGRVRRLFPVAVRRTELLVGADSSRPSSSAASAS